MIDVRKLYEEDIWGWSDYQPMIDAFGKVALQVDDWGYQGDTRVLYHNEDGRVGHLIFGWGSCSGCDSLQACGSLDDVQELANDLENDIKWFDTVEEALHWFKTYDWEGQYSWFYEETKKYVKEAIAYLEGKV